MFNVYNIPLDAFIDLQIIFNKYIHITSCNGYISGFSKKLIVSKLKRF